MTEGSEEFYSIFDHPSDLGISVRGSSLSNLFVNSAKALFLMITDLEKVRVESWQEISLEGADREDLLVRWLGELLFLHEARDWLFKDFQIVELGSNTLRAKAGGEIFQPKQHEIHREIKAVTYHDIRVEECAEGWRTRILFDI